MTVRRVALTMLDVPFVVETDDERIADLVELFWEPFLVAGAPADAVAVSVRRVDDRWQLRCEGDPGADALDPWVLVVVLRNVLSMRAIAGNDDVVPLHASVAERDGAYLVLSGPAEAGKTTLMLELLARGWGYVSDDMAPIGRRTGTARPFRKALQVRDPARWRATTDRWDVPAWLPPPVNASLVPARAFLASAGGPYAPTLLAFSRFVPGAEPSYETLAPGEAVALAAKNLQGRGPGPDDLGRLAEWAGAATAVRIVYGSTAAALSLLERGLGAASGRQRSREGL